MRVWAREKTRAPQREGSLSSSSSSSSNIEPERAKAQLWRKQELEQRERGGREPEWDFRNIGWSVRWNGSPEPTSFVLPHINTLLLLLLSYELISLSFFLPSIINFTRTRSYARSQRKPTRTEARIRALSPTPHAIYPSGTVRTHTYIHARNQIHPIRSKLPPTYSQRCARLSGCAVPPEFFLLSSVQWYEHRGCATYWRTSRHIEESLCDQRHDCDADTDPLPFMKNIWNSNPAHRRE